MATSTPNYALVKPAYSDWADITVLNNNLDIIDTQIFAKASKTRQIIAGLGLTGGGDLTTDRTLNIASANDGIIANADNIQLNTIDNLTTASSTKPLSANMGKVLQDTKLDLTGGTVTNGTNEVRIGVKYNNVTKDTMYMYNNAGSQGVYSVMPGFSDAGVIRRDKITGFVTYASGTFTGALNGTTATFSGNVTAPNLAYDTTQIIAGTGLVGGGDISTSRTLNIVSANDGIVVNADNIELKPATTSIIGGVKPDGTTTSVDVNGVISTVNRASTSTQIIAGTGLVGGGDISTSRTLNIVSANDGIVVNADNIELKPATTSIIGGVKPDGTTTSVDVNGVISTVNRASTSTQVIAGSGLTGGGTLAADRTLNIASANAGIIVNADNIELKPATTSVIGGVKPTVSNGGSTYDVSTGELYIPLSRKVFSTLGQIGLSGTVTIQEVVAAVVANAPCDFYIETSAEITTGLPSAYSSLHIISGGQTNNNMVTISAYCSGKHYVNRTIGTPPYTLVGWEQVITQEGGTLTGTLNGTTATFSGNVTAPNIITTNGTNTSAIYARYNNLATDQLYLYNSSTKTGIYSLMPTHGELDIISRSKSTGVVTYAGGAFSGDITAPNIITDTSVGTCTTLFSGTQQCGQNTWKDTGIDIPTTYSSVLIGVNIASSGIYDTESEFSRCTLTRGQTFLFAHQTQGECIMGKIIGNRLWTYTGAGAMTDNNLKTVIGITRR